MAKLVESDKSKIVQVEEIINNLGKLLENLDYEKYPLKVMRFPGIEEGELSIFTSLIVEI